MARIPCSYIPQGIGNNNFVSSQAMPFQIPGSGPITADFCPPNNLHQMQHFVPITSQVSPTQQSGNRGPLPPISSTPFSGGFGPSMQPYMQRPRWPPFFNCPASFVDVRSRLGYPHQDAQPTGSIPRFNAAFPPPSVVVSAQQWPHVQGDCHGNSTKRYTVDGAEDTYADQVWIESWLQCRSKGALAPPSVATGATDLKLWEMKKSLQDCWMILSNLEDLEKELTRSGKELEVIDWNRAFKEADLKKALFQKNLNIINENDVKKIKAVLSKRSKKRARQRKQRLLEKESSLMKCENRKKMHLEIDMWLEQQEAEVELLKQEESMKQEADAVLWGVRRKQSEGRKTLSLLSALVKLHNVRSKKKDFSSNPVPSEEQEQFTKIIDKLVHLWKGQMKDYEAEEKTLRVMMQESPEKDEGKVSKDELKHDLSTLERNNRAWEIALFGDISSSDRMLNLAVDLFRPFFLQPSQALDVFIESRRHWDQFISNSPSSSSIPIGWVMPKEASSKEWKEKAK